MLALVGAETGESTELTTHIEQAKPLTYTQLGQLAVKKYLHRYLSNVPRLFILSLEESE